MHPTTGTAPWIPQMYPDMCFQSVALVDSGEKSSSTSASPPEKHANKNNRWTNVLIHLLRHLAVEMQIRQTLSTDSNATILWCGQFFFLLWGTHYGPFPNTHHLPGVLHPMVSMCVDRWSPVVLIGSYRHPAYRPQFPPCHPNNPLPIKATFWCVGPLWWAFVWSPSIRDVCLFPFTQYFPTQKFTPPYKIHKLDATNFFAW